jgi:uncharacterized protein (TIGR02246 family)
MTRYRSATNDSTAAIQVMSDLEQDLVRSVLNTWKAAVDAHKPQQVAAVFTGDAIFQGLHPYTVGPQGIADYYADLPVGMTADYTVLETRRLHDDVVLAHLSVDFSFTDRPTLPVYLGVIIKRHDDAWQIAHYQVSNLDHTQ